MYNRTKVVLITISIFLLAAFFRLYGLNWDQGQHLHPDERFLTMVANGISWPKDLGEYLDTATSPLNPHNRGFGFFVYGTFPVFLTKWVAESLGQGDYGNLTFVGRALSAFADLGTVILVFLIGKQISTNQLINKSTNQQIKKKMDYWKLDNWLIPLLAMFLYSIMVLPIQLSHFYAVDTYLTFFITLSFYLLIKLLNSSSQLLTTNYQLPTFLGLSFGLALASKISAILFLPIIGLGLLIFLIKTKKTRLFFVICCLLSVVCYLTFRMSQPYAFANGNFFNPTLNQKLIENWKQLKSFSDPNSLFPPGVQWITSKPYLFPFKNMMLWGLGLPLGIISTISVIYASVLLGYWVIGLFKRKLSTTNYQLPTIFLSLLWILFLFSYQGSQFVKVMRYFHPIYPFFAIISGWFLYNSFIHLKNKFHWSNKFVALLHCCIVAFLLIYPLSFLSVYSNPHSRVTASAWIYKNIPAGSIISGEQWDDFLPLSLPQPRFTREKYIGIEFTPYAEDTASKWADFAKKLEKTDYIVLTSNRLYGSIMTVPDKYPVTNRYYQALFDGSLGFEKTAEITSRPNINLPFIHLCLIPPFARYGYIALQSQECTAPGISFVDDYADESFTVYDHPKVIIFKKVKPVDYFSLLSSAHKI